MTDVLVSLRVQGATQHTATGATQTWVPTVAARISGGLLLPAPQSIAMAPAGDTTIAVEPCDGTDGWCWLVTTTADGAIRDQRTVTVPTSVTPLYFEALTQVRPDDLRNRNADQVWVGLEDNPPPALFRGWWLVSAPGNPALGLETGSGDLRRVL